MALYHTWSGRYRVRRRSLPLPYHPPDRIPFQSAVYHDPHTQRPIRAEQEGAWYPMSCAGLCYDANLAPLLRAFIRSQPDFLPRCRYASASHHVSLGRRSSVEMTFADVFSYVVDHEELWQPAWGVRTGMLICRLSSRNCVIDYDVQSLPAIIGLQGFFPLKGEAAVGVGAVEYPIAERKRLATL